MMQTRLLRSCLSNHVKDKSICKSVFKFTNNNYNKGIHTSGVRTQVIYFKLIFICFILDFWQGLLYSRFVDINIQGIPQLIADIFDSVR